MIFIYLFFISSVIASVCPYPLDWKITTVGKLEHLSMGSMDFAFISEREILIVNYPQQGKESAPLHIYSEVDGKWVLDEVASKYLPSTFHGRQIIVEDILGDNQKEIIIADHGTDRPPYPGSHPHILQKIEGKWTSSKLSKSFPPDFTFNVVAMPLKNGNKAIYRANVNGKTPFFIEITNKGLRDLSSALPKDLSPFNLCFMTALKADFDSDGIPELFLGGCDNDRISLELKHDRILKFLNNRWTLLPSTTIPARRQNHNWGTVYVQEFDGNNDKKPDLLLATHDFGFHEGKVVVYENVSDKRKIKFKEIVLPLSQESNSEGYVNSLENFQIDGLGTGILAEVRNALRTSGKREVKYGTRFVLNMKEQYIDASSCLPEEVRKQLFQMKKFPNNSSKVLMVPFRGDILTLSASKIIK